MTQKINACLLTIGAFFGLLTALSAQSVTLQSGPFSLVIDPLSVRLSSGKTTLLESRGIELINDAGVTLPVEFVSVVKKDNGALQTLKAGDALIERKFMPVDGGFRVEEQFTELPSSALNLWYSSYAPGFENTWNYTPSVGGLVADTYYKSPVVIAAAEGVAVAIIPDLTD